MRLCDGMGGNFGEGGGGGGALRRFIKVHVCQKCLQGKGKCNSKL